MVIIENGVGSPSSTTNTCCKTILLGKLGYDTKWQALNMKDHGIPQSGPRLYIVAILPGKHDKHTSTWPKPVPSTRLLRFLDVKGACSKASVNDLAKPALDKIFLLEACKAEQGWHDVLNKSQHKALCHRHQRGGEVPPHHA